MKIWFDVLIVMVAFVNGYALYEMVKSIKEMTIDE